MVAAPLDQFSDTPYTYFDSRDLVPVAYAAFALTLGALLGALLKRTIVAMLATIASFVIVRYLISEYVRPHLIAPLTAISPFQVRVFSSGIGATIGPPQQSDWVVLQRDRDRVGPGRGDRRGTRTGRWHRLQGARERLGDAGGRRSVPEPDPDRPGAGVDGGAPALRRQLPSPPGRHLPAGVALLAAAVERVGDLRGAGGRARRGVRLGGPAPPAVGLRTLRAVGVDGGAKAVLLEAGAAFCEVAASLRSSDLDAPATGAWTLRELVAHATRGLLTIETTATNSVDPDARELESATAYFALAMSVPQIHVGIEQRARDAAAGVGDDPGGYAAAALERVTPIVGAMPRTASSSTRRVGCASVTTSPRASSS